MHVLVAILSLFQDRKDMTNYHLGILKFLACHTPNLYFKKINNQGHKPSDHYYFLQSRLHHVPTLVLLIFVYIKRKSHSLKPCLPIVMAPQ